MAAADMTIRKITNKTRGFYALMGPYLARREVAEEVGGPIWDDDGVTWFVGLKGGSVTGFCALRQGGGRAELRSWYMLPGQSKGAAASLFRARMDAIERPSAVRAVVRPSCADMFLRHGFVESRATKNFCTMTAELT